MGGMGMGPMGGMPMGGMPNMGMMGGGMPGTTPPSLGPSQQSHNPSTPQVANGPSQKRKHSGRGKGKAAKPDHIKPPSHPKRQRVQPQPEAARIQSVPVPEVGRWTKERGLEFTAGAPALPAPPPPGSRMSPRQVWRSD
ncbi:RRM domain-containing protein [Colletotrichum tofieldiae]|nr:RRM domain-containing protein [Colletotrichum tofieldiae]GKT71612.1 RRM domain-containing protein [Colletotrichum tofieldiae]GKT95227.1 RRM domain-containing protein [Colletotrichum tofieldiae]